MREREKKKDRNVIRSTLPSKESLFDEKGRGENRKEMNPCPIKSEKLER